MGEALLTTLSMENYHPSTLLSMDSGSLAHDDLEREMNRSVILSRPPDINLPLSSEPSPPPPLTWNDPCDILDVGLGPQAYEVETIVSIPKVVKKCTKRLDSIWGAWFFFSFYFKPVLNEKSKCKIIRDSNGVSGFEKSDLQLDSFLVQHDMENMYMWVFKERPENTLGKMQLRSYMNGHSRQGEPPFPFSVDRGFVRSHRMQRKHYRGLSNPQCVHGIEVVRSPSLMNLDDEERKRWAELTGRDINFSIPLEASDFGSWRNLPNTEFELERPSPAPKSNGNAHPRKLLNGTGLNLSTQSSDHINGEGIDLSPISNKRKHGGDDEFLHSVDMNIHPVERTWLNEFSGVMKNVNGPVTAAKTIYEDEKAFLVIVSLPFADLQRVKVTWRNTKCTCTYISRHVTGLSSYSRASKSGRDGASFCWARISAMSSNGASSTRKVALALEGPSCICVGPIETASQETLEALYSQARDAYYSGEPLIIDDMFDRIELRLRWYGSKCVVKYPRCSIRRQSTYSDAEVDISQASALASIWTLFLTVGCSACALPIIYTIGLAYQDAFGTVLSHGSQTPIIGFLATVNGILFMAVSALIGYPIASASVKVLQGLWSNDLVALKGACPNCGEEVFAFVKSDQSNNSPHRADCHVCESLLEFRTQVEQTISRVGRRWVYGRIYLVSRRRQKWK